MKVLILGRALLPSVPSLGRLPPEVYHYIEESQRYPEGGVRFPQGMLIPGAPYSGRRYFALAFALAKIADVKFYGPGYPDYRESWLPTYDEIDVSDVIARLYGSDYPDVVMQLSPCNAEGMITSFKNFENARCLRVLWAADFHNDVSHLGIPERMRAGQWHLIVKSFDYHGVTEYSKLVENAKVPQEWLPFSIDPEVFKDYGQTKIYDVINMGSFFSSYYPLRIAMHKILEKYRGSIKYVCGYDFVTETNRIAGVMTDEYAKIINQGKIYTTCTSTFKYPGIKLFEIMACNTLLFCDKPLDADVLGLQHGVNYHEVGQDPWHFDPAHAEKAWLDEQRFMEVINFYLTNESERLRIARNGYELVHNRHTNEVRAKEFLSILQKYVR